MNVLTHVRCYTSKFTARCKAYLVIISILIHKQKVLSKLYACAVLLDLEFFKVL